MLHNKVSTMNNFRLKRGSKFGISGAFEDFLSTYESTASDVDAFATDALEGLNIDEDGISDEYVMVDDAGDGKNIRKPGEFRGSKKKYLNMLQQVADRQISEVTIELDDLDNVRNPLLSSTCHQRPLLTVGLQYEKSYVDDTSLRLVESIERNAKRYIDVLSQAVDKVMPKETKEIS